MYQVGFASRIQAKKFSALKPGVQNTRAAARKRREQARNQPVNVKQRHDVEAAIGRREG